MVEQIVLHPGDVYFGEGPRQIRTLLGSCVAISLWHPRLHIGGMCHFVLPTRPANQARKHAQELDGRYGDEALEAMLQCIRHNGTHTRDYVTGVFGGSRVYQGSGRRSGVGESNCEQALLLLANLGMDVLHMDCGGGGYRSLQFDLASGEISVRHEHNPPADYWQQPDVDRRRSTR